MPERELLLKRIEDAYASRMRGDASALAGFWAEDAQFRMAGEPNLIRAIPLEAAAGGEVANGYLGLYHFHGFERMSAVVEGNRAAVHWRVQVSTGNGAPVTTELYDLWEFDERGKAKSLLQFADTALMAEMVA